MSAALMGCEQACFFRLVIFGKGVWEKEGDGGTCILRQWIWEERRGEKDTHEDNQPDFRLPGRDLSDEDKEDG
jgi:hypothetical protein